MPNADGIKATTMIRRFDISTPIISMTSDIREHDMGRYADSGMNDILPKPFNQYAVLNILEVSYQTVNWIALITLSTEILDFSVTHFRKYANKVTAE